MIPCASRGQRRRVRSPALRFVLASMVVACVACSTGREKPAPSGAPLAEPRKTTDSREGGTGTRAKGEQGTKEKPANQRYAVAGPTGQAHGDGIGLGLIGVL